AGKDELLAKGRVESRPPRPWLGLYTQERAGGGVVVAGVSPAGPARSAGFRQGDIIVRINGEQISTHEEFYRRLRSGGIGQQLHPSLTAEFPDEPSAALSDELLRMSGLLHDIGHGPFGHFFDDNFLVDFDLTHEKLGQRIITEQLGDLIRGQRRSPSGPFEPGENIDPEWICYLMGKSYTKPESAHPRWLAHLKPLLSGIYTADNMDYVLRDSYMCGVAVGPIDIERIIYYSFFSDKGLTLDRGGIQAFIMFLNARFYMYTNVYYHRTTRGIDLHLKEIFRDTI